MYAREELKLLGLPANMLQSARDPLSVPLIGGAEGFSNVEAFEGGCLRPPLVPQRLVLAVLLHMGLATAYAMRVGLSVVAAPPSAVVGNVTHTLPNGNATHPSATARSNATMYSELGWSNTEEGIVLGSFFQGYLLTQVLGAVFARRFGGYSVLATAMLASCALTLATPLVAESFRLLVVCRTSLGLVQGALYPSTLTLVAKWYTPSERASYLGFIIAGPYLGEALTFPLAALVMESPLGWRFVFYLIAMTGGVWVLLFLGLAASSPDEHPRISAAERQHLATALGVSSHAAAVPNPPSPPPHDNDPSGAEISRSDDGEVPESRKPVPAESQAHWTDAGEQDGAPREQGDNRDEQSSRQVEGLQDYDGERDAGSSLRRGGRWEAKGGSGGGSAVGCIETRRPRNQTRRSAGGDGCDVAQDNSRDADSSRVDVGEQDPRVSTRKTADLSERPEVEKKDEGIPWKAILTCKAAWACWIGHTVYSWNFYTLLTQLPSYLSLELHLNPDQAGWILCMAYLLMLATSVFAGIVADRILIARLAARSTIRKCAEIVSVLLPSVLLYAGSTVSQPRLSIYLLISAIGFMGFCSAGHHTNYLEISRSLSGILMGVGNTLTCLAGSRSLLLSWCHRSSRPFCLQQSLILRSALFRHCRSHRHRRPC